MSKNADQMAAQIRAAAGDAPVEISLILGAGLGHLADAVSWVAIPCF